MKNLILLLMLSILVLMLCGWMNKTELTPLQFLRGKKRLTIHREKLGLVDTLDTFSISLIATLQFEDKNQRPSPTGTVSDRSISIQENGRKIVLLNFWKVQDNYILNINDVENHTLYRGYKIEKRKLENAIPILKKKSK